MYLTKIQLDIYNRTVCYALSDCQRMHRMINGLFATDREGAQLQYRVQNTGRSCAVYLYSDMPIDRSRLLPFMTFVGERDLGAWLASMTEGRTLSFDLVTMPSKKERGEVNSRRRILREADKRSAWLARKAEQNGFVLLDVHELESASLTGKHEKERGGYMVWDTYHYRGILQITDSERFRKALQTGIGPGKAYGLGMILLK